MPSAFWKHAYLFAAGFSDSFKFKNFNRYCFSTNRGAQKIRQTLIMSFIHLGLFFILTHIIFNKLQNNKHLGNALEFVMKYPFVQKLLQLLYYGLWVVPQYIGLLIYTQFWFGDIAENAATIEKEQYKNKSFQISDDLEVDSMIALKMKKIIFTLVYLCFSLTFSFVIINIPYFGFISMILLYAIYYAIFIFMVKWSYDDYILAYFEDNLFYFLGFGLFYSVFTNLFLGILNDGFYWLLFPLYILNSTNSSPPLTDAVSDFKSFWKAIRSPDIIQENSFLTHQKKLKTSKQYLQKCKM